MNKFEEKFFKKYIPEDQNVKWIIHIHWIDIIWKIFLWLTSWALIPSFLYYYSERIRDFIPFYFLEILLIIIYIKIIYDIFDWYNDVWIITKQWITELERSLFKVKTNSVSFNSIEWLEVEQDWIIDKILKKWNLYIHKIWEESFKLLNCTNPQTAVNTIEEINNEVEIEENDIEDDKFDTIMDALWWVVENYLDKKTQKTEKQQMLEGAILKIQEKKWTIDLR